jgi:PIN domain nuclease of toxin-antitoxin system
MGSQSMRILLDTHIFIWYVLGSPRLSETLQNVLTDETNQLWLSPISIWEALLLAEKKRVTLQPDPITWIEESLQQIDIREALLSKEIAILSRQIDLDHQDPADRFIAATAVYYALTLATVDRHLVSATWLNTIS